MPGWTTALGRGAVVVDTRSPAKHARRHVPGSLSIPAGPSFGTWLGWVVDADAPIVLIVDDPADLDDLARQAIRIGCETIEGYVDGGFEGWARSGRPVEDGAAIDVDDLAAALSAGGPLAPLVIDVRQPYEFEAGHLPGAVHIGAGELPDVLDRLPHDREVAAGLRQRLPLEHRRVTVAGRRVQPGRGGRRRHPGLGSARLPARLRRRHGRSRVARHPATPAHSHDG